MDIIGIAFGVGLLIWWAERRDHRRAFPEQPCRYCSQLVHLERGEWFHEDGTAFGQWPQLDYETFPDLPLHAAGPSITSDLFLS